MQQILGRRAAAASPEPTPRRRCGSPRTTGHVRRQRLQNLRVNGVHDASRRAALVLRSSVLTPICVEPRLPLDAHQTPPEVGHRARRPRAQHRPSASMWSSTPDRGAKRTPEKGSSVSFRARRPFSTTCSGAQHHAGRTRSFGALPRPDSIPRMLPNLEQDLELDYGHHLTIEPATVPRISNAASGPPVSVRGIKAPSKARSTATLITDNATPAPMQTSGQNHMLVCSQ